MAIKRYTKAELKNLIRTHFQEEVDLIPIGNHELRRHQVYRLTMHQKEYVFKYYYQTGYVQREIAALKTLQDRFENIPHLIDYGIIDNDREWILMEKLEGTPFFKVQKHLDKETIQSLYHEMGKYLKKLHSVTFDFYGNWDKDQHSVCTEIDLETSFWNRTLRTVDLIENSELHNQNLLMEGLSLLRKLSSSVLVDTTPVFCHNDYNSRNVLIKKKEGQWKITGILDFEQSIPFEKEFDFVHLKLFDFLHYPHSEDAFFEGYGDHHLDERKINFFILYQSLKIATWAYYQSPDYYKVAIDEIKKQIKNLS